MGGEAEAVNHIYAYYRRAARQSRLTPPSDMRRDRDSRNGKVVIITQIHSRWRDAGVTGPPFFPAASFAPPSHRTPPGGGGAR